MSGAVTLAELNLSEDEKEQPSLEVLLRNVLCCACAHSRAAEDINKIQPTGYVMDLAGVIKPDTKAQLEAMCLELQQKTGSQMAIVTVKSLDGNEAAQYANDLFKHLGVGAKKQDDGVLLLVAPNDRKYWIEVGYGLEPVINDARAGDAGRLLPSYFRAGDYSGGITAAAWQLAKYIADSKGVTLTGQPQMRQVRQQRTSQRRSWVWIVLAVILFMILASRRETQVRARGGGRAAAAGGLARSSASNGAEEAEAGAARAAALVEAAAGAAVAVASADLAAAVAVAAERAEAGRLTDRLGKIFEMQVMAMEAKLGELVSRLKEAAGKNLESVILYGSAARGDFHPGRSDLNVLCTLVTIDMTELHRLAPGRSVVDTRDERTGAAVFPDGRACPNSTDVFAIESLDIKAIAKVLFGKDVVADLEIPMNLHRVEVERNMRELLLKLRQHVLHAGRNEMELTAVMKKTISGAKDAAAPHTADVWRRASRWRQRTYLRGWAH